VPLTFTLIFRNLIIKPTKTDQNRIEFSTDPSSGYAIRCRPHHNKGAKLVSLVQWSKYLTQPQISIHDCTTYLVTMYKITQYKLFHVQNTRTNAYNACNYIPLKTITNTIKCRHTVLHKPTYVLVQEITHILIWLKDFQLL
jgi:hypothetical protein